MTEVRYERGRNDAVVRFNAYTRGRIYHADDDTRCGHGVDLKRAIPSYGPGPFDHSIGDRPLGEVTLPLPLLCQAGRTLGKLEFDADGPFVGLADDGTATWPEPRPVLPVTGQVDTYSIRLQEDPLGPGMRARLAEARSLPVDQDPRAKQIANMQRDLAEQTRIIGLLVARLGGEVLISDVELAATEGVLHAVEDRAAGGWRLWVKTDG
jgi:hypothetical protein